MRDEALVAAGVESGTDALVDVELQDEAPALSEPRTEVSGPELTALFRSEAAEQGQALRGPIYIDELATDEVRPAVWYRRLSRDEKRQLQQDGAELKKNTKDCTAEDVTAFVFMRRALNSDGARLFVDMQVEEARAGNWNDDAIMRVVTEMAAGSRTRLSDEDLGNS